MNKLELMKDRILDALTNQKAIGVMMDTKADLTVQEIETLEQMLSKDTIILPWVINYTNGPFVHGVVFGTDISAVWKTYEDLIIHMQDSSDQSDWNIAAVSGLVYSLEKLRPVLEKDYNVSLPKLTYNFGTIH